MGNKSQHKFQQTVKRHFQFLVGDFGFRSEPDELNELAVKFTSHALSVIVSTDGACILVDLSPGAGGQVIPLYWMLRFLHPDSQYVPESFDSYIELEKYLDRAVLQAAQALSVCVADILHNDRVDWGAIGEFADSEARKDILRGTWERRSSDKGAS